MKTGTQSRKILTLISMYSSWRGGALGVAERGRQLQGGALEGSAPLFIWVTSPEGRRAHTRTHTQGPGFTVSQGSVMPRARSQRVPARAPTRLTECVLR